MSCETFSAVVESKAWRRLKLEFIPVTFEFPVQLYHWVVKPLIWTAEELVKRRSILYTNQVMNGWWKNTKCKQPCLQRNHLGLGCESRWKLFLSSFLRKLMCNGEGLFVSNVMLKTFKSNRTSRRVFFISVQTTRRQVDWKGMDCWYLLNKNYLSHTNDDSYEWAIYLNLSKSEIEKDLYVFRFWIWAL